jgi:hypothetical protein
MTIKLVKMSMFLPIIIVELVVVVVVVVVDKTVDKEVVTGDSGVLSGHRNL